MKKILSSLAFIMLVIFANAQGGGVGNGIVLQVEGHGSSNALASDGAGVRGGLAEGEKGGNGIIQPQEDQGSGNGLASDGNQHKGWSC